MTRNTNQRNAINCCRMACRYLCLCDQFHVLQLLVTIAVLMCNMSLHFLNQISPLSIQNHKVKSIPILNSSCMACEEGQYTNMCKSIADDNFSSQNSGHLFSGKDPHTTSTTSAVLCLTAKQYSACLVMSTRLTNSHTFIAKIAMPKLHRLVNWELWYLWPFKEQMPSTNRHYFKEEQRSNLGEVQPESQTLLMEKRSSGSIGKSI